MAQISQSHLASNSERFYAFETKIHPENTTYEIGLHLSGHQF